MSAGEAGSAPHRAIPFARAEPSQAPTTLYPSGRADAPPSGRATAPAPFFVSPCSPGACHGARRKLCFGLGFGALALVGFLLSVAGVVLFLAGVRAGHVVASRCKACQAVYDVALSLGTVFAVAACVCWLVCVPGFAVAWLVVGWVVFGGVAVGVAWSD